MPTPKVLIIEDDLNLSSVLKGSFEKNGFEVVQSFDGQQGYDALTSDPVPPNVILLDILMPNLNGFEFVDKVRSSPKDYSQIPIMVLTNLSQKEDYEKMMMKGTVSYFVKSSYEPRQIVDQVKVMLQRLQ